MWHSKPWVFTILLASLIYSNNGNALTRIDPLVESKIGLIRGLRASDGDYSMFMGIPYATVNESNPFGPSIPHPGFDDTFEAYDDSAICPQIEEFGNTNTGSLDCLHLNIYVPNTANSRNRLPVMVWIYGGGFSIGSSGRRVYGPQYLVRQGIILVTFNYRVGPYGFMCLGTPDVPGNQGIRDQQSALRWIKNNIESFGGDANKITIFGESAGGASVDFHLTYGQEKLFDQVIMQSGVAVCPWAVIQPDISVPLKLAENLGFITVDVNEALEFLANTDPKLVIASTSDLNLLFRPCVENDFNDVEIFIDDHPVNVNKRNLGNIPILIGYNSDEMLFEYEHLTPRDYASLNSFYDILQEYFNFDSEKLIDMEAQVRQFYIGDEDFSEDIKEELIKFASDFSFNHPVVRTINKYFSNGATNIYQYVFFYDGDRNFLKLINNITAPGAAHADEISYLFDVSFFDRNLSERDQLIVDRMTTMWANFAKYGNPTPEATELLPVQWPTAKKDLLYYLNIDTELKVEKRHFRDRMAMWNLFYKLNEKYQLGYQDSDD